MSIELVIAALMAVVAILVGFAGPAPDRDHAGPNREIPAHQSRSEAGTPEG